MVKYLDENGNPTRAYIRRKEGNAKVFIPLKDIKATCVKCNISLPAHIPRLRLARGPEHNASICLDCLSKVLGDWVKRKQEWLILAQEYVAKKPYLNIEDQLNKLAALRTEDPITASLLEALE